jgi:hypothetical protein
MGYLARIGETRKFIELLVESPRRKDYFGHLGMNGRIIKNIS